MAAAAGVIFWAALSSVFFTSISCEDRVPVLAWQNQSPRGSWPSVSAVDQVSIKDFEADIKPALRNKGPFVVFLQDEFSLEDFTLYGNVYDAKNQKNSFPNIQNLLESNPSIMFPSVVSPYSSISSLAHDRNRIDFKSGQIDYTDVNDSLVVFHLPSTATAPDRRQALEANDKIIGDAIARVTSVSPSYTAIYTGQRSPWAESSRDGERTRRHTLAEGSGNYTLVLRNATTNATCFMFYADSLTLSVNSTSTVYNVSMTDLMIDGDSSDCSTDDTLNVTIKTQPTAEIKFQIQFDFGRAEYDDWIINNMTVTYNDVIYTVWLPPQSIWAPQAFCYHCTPQKFQLQDQSGKKVATLGAPNFQIQAFEFDGNPDAPFGDYFDCVGFFSIAIWMTIFFCIILVAILGFGINAIMSIKTMDRFDDPKGKTISVSATD